MRGQPFVQLLLVILVFIALLWPVVQLTRPAATPPPPNVSAGGPAEVELTLTAAFVPAPDAFQLRSLGRDLLTGRGPQSEWTGTWKTALPAEGADLSLSAVWPDANVPAAARVTVRFPDDRPPVERTFWVAHGKLTELVTVPGANP